MKYLVDRYKERKDWNRKQSGGSIWKSQHYDEIDAVLVVRDAVTFENVAEAGSASTSSQSQGSPESFCSTPSTGNASNQSSASIEKERRRQRKKGRLHLMRRYAGLLKTVTEQGERITGVMEKMQEAQTKQMDMMTQFMGAMLEMMKNEKSSS